MATDPERRDRDIYTSAEEILQRWISAAHALTAAGENDPHTLAKLDEFRHLHLDGSLIPIAVEITKTVLADHELRAMTEQETP